MCCAWARDRAKAERCGAGGGERQCCAWARDRAKAERSGAGDERVCCASARDRAKAERSGAGGKRVCCAWARDRAKAERSGAGGSESQCVVHRPEIERRQNVVGLVAVSASVRCVCASDIVIERSRKAVVHLERGTEFEWRQGQTRRSDQTRTNLLKRDLLLNFW